MNMYVKGAN